MPKKQRSSISEKSSETNSAEDATIAEQEKLLKKIDEQTPTDTSDDIINALIDKINDPDITISPNDILEELLTESNERKEDRKGSGTKNLSVNFTNLMSSDLTLSEYETYCFRQKIGVVAGLYCDKSGVKKADKLISKLEKEAKTSDEKDLVRAVRQNKKLLLAKGTKGFKK